MAWDFKTDRPIYTQVLEQIRFHIISGTYPAGGKIPSVRDLATEAAVNPNTMQKALSELERSGLIYSHRTSGRFVTEDDNMIKQVREDMAKEQIMNFFKLMEKLGYNPDETVYLLQQIVKEMK